MSNESNFVIKNVDVKCFYDDIVNCIYFNKISKFVFITRNLHIYHMSTNNTITHYNKNKCIRKPHNDHYSKYDFQMVQNNDALLILLDSQIYYTTNGYDFNPIIFVCDGRQIAHDYKKIKYLKSIDNKIFAYGTNILLESNDGRLFYEFNNLDEVHDVYLKDNKCYVIASKRKDKDAYNMYAPSNYDVVMCSINRGKIDSEILNKHDIISAYNVKTHYEKKVLSINYTYLNNEYEDTASYQIKDIDYGYLDNIVNDSTQINIDSNNMSIDRTNDKRYVININDNLNFEYPDLHSINDITPTKIYCCDVDGYYEVISLFNDNVSGYIVHHKIKH